MTTQRIVSELNPQTKYYYRVRPYGSASPGAAVMSETTASSSGLVIHPTFDSSITTNARSAVIQATVTQAIAAYQSLFSDPITVSILFRFSPNNPDGSSMGADPARSSYVVYPIAWNSFLTNLRADAKTSNDALAVATFPTTALTANVAVSGANGRAIGLDTRPAMFANGSVGAGGPFDGIVTLNSNSPLQFLRPVSALNYDALTGTQHEIDEVLGLGSYLGSNHTDMRPMDLFSWQSVNVRNTHSTGTRYFSINSGQTPLVYFNQQARGDLGDWLSTSCPQTNFRVQDAFGCPGQSADVTAASVEATALDVIGYDLSSAASGILSNLSARAVVGTGTDVAIGGFIVGGTGPKSLLLRALGPTLAQFGVSGALQDPTLELHNSSGLIATNDDWAQASNAQSIPANLRPPNPAESAILTNLNPGAYTIVVRGANDTSGVGLAEVYDIATTASSHLTNISARAQVGVDPNVLIAGLSVQSGSKTVLIRALGPTLASFGIPNPLADPTLELRDANGNLLTFNDNWQSSQAAEISASGYAPPNSAEPALIRTLTPANYTAVVRGVNQSTGVALVEVYTLN